MDQVMTADEFVTWVTPHVEVEANFTQDNNETRTLNDYISDLILRLERIQAGELEIGYNPAYVGRHTTP